MYFSCNPATSQNEKLIALKFLLSGGGELLAEILIIHVNILHVDILSKAIKYLFNIS